MSCLYHPTNFPFDLRGRLRPQSASCSSDVSSLWIPLVLKLSDALVEVPASQTQGNFWSNVFLDKAIPHHLELSFVDWNACHTPLRR